MAMAVHEQGILMKQGRKESIGTQQSVLRIIQGYLVSSKLAFDCLGDRLGEVLNVVAVQAGHRDATICSHVDVCLFSKSLGLSRVQASKTNRIELAATIKNIARK